MINALLNGLSLSGRAALFLSREVRGMHAAAYVLGFSALISSLLALLRDRLLAHTFGAGIELDLYYAAFRIPDLLFVALGALVSVYVLIPVLAGRSDKEQRDYIDTVVTGFSIFAAVASVVAAVAAPYLLRMFFPTLAIGETLSALVLLTRVLLLQPILLGLSNIVAAITQYKHRYTLYALAPIVYNVGIIMGIAWFYPALGLVGLVLGVVAGALFHLGIQLPTAFADGFFRSLPRFTEMSVLFKTARISIPRALALSMSQLSFLGLLIIAGGLPTGSISIFMFAFNLQAVPLAIIGASYSVAAFPTLATLSKNGSGEFLNYVATAARHVLFWSMPALALMIVLRAHAVRAILGSGEFDWTDTRLTAAAFALFALSLAAQGITLLLVRAYYASGKTAFPLIVATGTAIVTVLASVLFITTFENDFIISFIEAVLRVENVFGAEMLALPLAYALAAICGAFVLAIHFNWQHPGFFSAIVNAFWESVTAGFFAGVAAYGSLVVLGTVTLSSTLASVLIRGGIAGVVGIAAAAYVYYLLNSREFAEAVQAVRRRMWRDVEPVSSAEGAGTGIPRA
jgi:putative peptidoglycan lipid II flippase